MLFTSPEFLFIFLPLVFIIHLVLPYRFKNTFLFLSSILFYAWGEKLYFLLLLGSTLIDFFAGRLIYKGNKKLGLLFSLFSNIGILVFFKYSNFFIENWNQLYIEIGLNWKIPTLKNLELPLGISFFTFQTLSYTIDVYRGKVGATKSIIDLGTYVSLFPQLVAGPIVRYKDVYASLQKRKVQLNGIFYGLTRFIIGLFKKLVIANHFGYIADEIFNLPLELVTTDISWIGSVSYAIQIYFDFSGYSDMAIGLGYLFGFRFLENFNYPYYAKSIQDFWRRWHISLSTWFRDYLYISLGGNRKGKYRTFFNLFFVFYITGMWHGASWNFILWGLFHGLFLVCERFLWGNFLKRIPTPFSLTYQVIVVLVGWILFRAENLNQAIVFIKSLFLFSSFSNPLFKVYYFINFESLTIFLLALGFIFPWYNVIDYKLRRLIVKTGKFQSSYGILKVVVLITMLYISMLYLAADTYNPFIYFRF